MTTERPLIYHTGSSRGYLRGAAFVALAIAVTWGHARNPLLRPDDRPLMAGIAALTFGGAGLLLILHAAVPRVTLYRERICVRRGLFEVRCTPLDRIRRITWSYVYSSGFLDRIDGGRAWIELEVLNEHGLRRRLLIEYGGRARHRAMAALVAELVARTGLHWSDGVGPDQPPPHEGEIYWER